MIPLPDRLKEQRNKKHLTQKQVADILKIRQGTYCDYERGNHQPSLEILIKIADTFETSTDYLLGRFNRV